MLLLTLNIFYPDWSLWKNISRWPISRRNKKKITGVTFIVWNVSSVFKVKSNDDAYAGQKSVTMSFFKEIVRYKYCRYNYEVITMVVLSLSLSLSLSPLSWNSWNKLNFLDQLFSWFFRNDRVWNVVLVKLTLLRCIGPPSGNSHVKLVSSTRKTLFTESSCQAFS